MSFCGKSSLTILKASIVVKRCTPKQRKPAVVVVSVKSEDKMNKGAEMNNLCVGLSYGLASVTSCPLAAEAATLTPSLQNLLYSVLAGAIVATVIATGVTFVSTFDPLNRRN